MALWNVTTSGDTIRFGAKARKTGPSGGCNEPFRGAYWCPSRKWFSKEPCPFTCRQECDNYRRMCGRL